MPTIRHTVTRSAAPATIARSAVKAGEVFKVIIKGAPGKKTYVGLGHNGKQFSLNIANGELASTSKKDKRVTLVGKATFRAAAFDPLAPGRATTRGSLTHNAVFKVKGGECTYLNLGRLRDGNYVAVNAGKAMGEDYAVGRDGSKNVEQVSTWSVDVTLAA